MYSRFRIFFSIFCLIIFSRCKQNINLKSQSKEALIVLSFPHYTKLANLELGCLDNKMNVTIVNTTDSIIRLYEEDNSWGYYNISFEIKTPDSLYIVRKKERNFWKNVPFYTILNP